VTNFCSKCGAQVSPGLQFCGACGTLLSAGGAGAAMAPSFQPAAVPIKRGGNSALKVVLIIVAVFVGLGVLGAGAFGFFVWRLAHAFHVSKSGNEVRLNTSQGSFTANTTEKFTASELGADIYPGAQPGKGSMRMSLPTGSVVSAVYVTPDSREQVVAFYKGKFGSQNVSSFDTENGSVMTFNKTQQESVVVTITANPSEYGGKTQIHIVHTSSTKPT
jgi:zinc-ribbon domain